MEKIRQYNEKERFHDKLEKLMRFITKLQNVVVLGGVLLFSLFQTGLAATPAEVYRKAVSAVVLLVSMEPNSCLLYTSDAADE